MKKVLFALALCCAFLPVYAQEKISDKDLVNVIYAMGQMYPDGFTLGLDTMRQPTEGLMVSYKETQNSFARYQYPGPEGWSDYVLKYIRLMSIQH